MGYPRYDSPRPSPMPHAGEDDGSRTLSEAIGAFGPTYGPREQEVWMTVAASVGRDNPAVGKMSERIAAISTWIDQHPPNLARGREAQLWGRIAKVSEEQGEVIEALIAATGQNPRKPEDPAAIDRVTKELLDVALTALAAVEHVTGNRGYSPTMLADHIGRVHYRAGLDTPTE